jgi:hypothetical protein
MDKTIVFQSYRTYNVAGWIDDCLWTVRQWASKLGYDYAFLGDEIFDSIPGWFKEKTSGTPGKMCLWSDLARLQTAKRFLSEGYDRTVWLDADILIFDPEAFSISIHKGTGFCEEIWLEKVAWSEALADPVEFARKKRRSLTRLWSSINCYRRINNAVSVFNQDNNFLDFYISSCLDLVSHKEALVTTELGASFLSPLGGKYDFTLIDDVGLFSPLVLDDIASGRAGYLETYMRRCGRRLHAANLCGSFLSRRVDGVHMREELYERVVGRLLDTRGEVVNRLVGPPSPGDVPGVAYIPS